MCIIIFGGQFRIWNKEQLEAVSLLGYKILKGNYNLLDS